MRSIALALCFGAATASAATHTVTIEGMQFQPAVLTVKRGDRIVWVNRDVVPHTVMAQRAFSSPAIKPGASWTTTLKRTDRLDYVCTLHPTMKARLVVQ